MEKIGVGLYVIHKGWVVGHPPSVPPPLCLPRAIVEGQTTLNILHSTSVWASRRVSLRMGKLHPALVGSEMQYAAAYMGKIYRTNGLSTRLTIAHSP
jgi:hypothetical protein